MHPFLANLLRNRSGLIGHPLYHAGMANQHARAAMGHRQAAFLHARAAQAGMGGRAMGADYAPPSTGYAPANALTPAPWTGGGNPGGLGNLGRR